MLSQFVDFCPRLQWIAFRKQMRERERECVCVYLISTDRPVHTACPSVAVAPDSKYGCNAPCTNRSSYEKISLVNQKKKIVLQYFVLLRYIGKMLIYACFSLCILSQMLFSLAFFFLHSNWIYSDRSEIVVSNPRLGYLSLAILYCSFIV
jgi:hypothetical protein